MILQNEKQDKAHLKTLCPVFFIYGCGVGKSPAYRARINSPLSFIHFGSDTFVTF